MTRPNSLIRSKIGFFGTVTLLDEEEDGEEEEEGEEGDVVEVLLAFLESVLFVSLS